MIALGAGRVLDIKETGDTAIVHYNSPERPFDVTMKRNGDRWQIVAIKDEIIARRIAEKIGQEIITCGKKRQCRKSRKTNRYSKSERYFE